MRILILILILAWSPAFAAQYSGTPYGINDGDTLKVDGQTIRMFGYDTPETGYKKGDNYISQSQECRLGKGCYKCGTEAKKALVKLINSRKVVCETTGKKTYGRWPAICRAGSDNLNLEMVRLGWGLPYWGFMRSLKEAQQFGRALDEAISNNRGIHRGAFIPPSRWRNKKERLDCEKPY